MCCVDASRSLEQRILAKAPSAGSQCCFHPGLGFLSSGRPSSKRGAACRAENVSRSDEPLRVETDQHLRFDCTRSQFRLRSMFGGLNMDPGARLSYLNCNLLEMYEFPDYVFPDEVDDVPQILHTISNSTFGMTSCSVRTFTATR